MQASFRYKAKRNANCFLTCIIHFGQRGCYAEFANCHPRSVPKVFYSLFGIASKLQMSFWRNLLLSFIRQGIAVCVSCQEEKEKVRLCDRCLLPAVALSLIQTVWKDHPGQSSIETWPALSTVIKTRCNKNLAWVRKWIPDISGINPDCIALEINSSLTVPVTRNARLLLCLLCVRSKPFTRVIF